MIYPPNKPPEPKPPVEKLLTTAEVPSEEILRALLKAGQRDIVLQYIDTFKLKYKVEDDSLIDCMPETEIWLKKFVTVDNECIKLKDDIRKLAKVPYEVLICGETGTGKELLARALRGESTGKFIAINCAGLPTELIESELFGYVKGSFTGAAGDKQGLMAAASGGVLFMDEVGELAINVQAKLLRAIQDRRIRRVGSNMEEQIDCRFIFATHRDLNKMVEHESFRKDLFARISTFELSIPPLKDRQCDIIPIIESINGGKELVKALQSKYGNIKIDTKFNVRSLEQCVKRYKVLGHLPLMTV